MIQINKRYVNYFNLKLDLIIVGMDKLVLCLKDQENIKLQLLRRPDRKKKNNIAFSNKLENINISSSLLF